MCVCVCVCVCVFAYDEAKGGIIGYCTLSSANYPKIVCDCLLIVCSLTLQPYLCSRSFDVSVLVCSHIIILEIKCVACHFCYHMTFFLYCVSVVTPLGLSPSIIYSCPTSRSGFTLEDDISK